MHQIDDNKFVIGGSTRLVNQDRVHDYKVLICVGGPLGRKNFVLLPFLSWLIVFFKLTLSVKEDNCSSFLLWIKKQQLRLEFEIVAVLDSERSQLIRWQVFVVIITIPVLLVLLERIGDCASHMLFTVAVKIQHVEDQSVVPNYRVFFDLQATAGHLDLLVSFFHLEELRITNIIIRKVFLCSIHAVNAANLKVFVV